MRHYIKLLFPILLLFLLYSGGECQEKDPKRVFLSSDVEIELVYIPSGSFIMGSSQEEKVWATSWHGGAEVPSGLPGTGYREMYEGEPQLTHVKDSFYMGRTAITVAQFRQFIEETGYITDAEEEGDGDFTGGCEVWDPEWEYNSMLPIGENNPWKHTKGKSWRDPNFGFPLRDDYPVVCTSYNDDLAFCDWLTKREKAAGRLPEGMVYRLPTEAEWEYAARGGRNGEYFWWGSNIMDGKGRLNISGLDLIPGRDISLPFNKVPWMDGFAWVSPVDFYGKKGRNGFGLADVNGNVWEFVLDEFDPTGGHEELYLDEDGTVTRNVCKGGNYFDVPGDARTAVRLGIKSTDYSDSRDGFRICLGVPVQ